MWRRNGLTKCIFVGGTLHGTAVVRSRPVCRDVIMPVGDPFSADYSEEVYVVKAGCGDTLGLVHKSLERERFPVPELVMLG